MTSRRVFVRNGALALLSLGFAPSFLARTAAAGQTSRSRVLVAVFQRGAVDGLNMVVPFGEREYYAARPGLAIARPGAGPEAAVDLDGFFGLHPRLGVLKPWYDAGRLAVVHACGSHDATRSHFDAQDYLESATPGVKSTPDGWLNRYLRSAEREEATAFRAVALADSLPRALQGAAPALAVSQLDRFGIRASRRNPAAAGSFEAVYESSRDALLERTGREAFDAVRLLRAANPAQYQPSNGAAYPRSPFGEALKQIGQLIKANVGLEIAFAESDGWDHHVNQGAATGQMAARLDDLGRGIAALATDLGDRMEDVLVLTMSEFGRAVAENGNRGTDHGHGNAMLALGGPVAGGKVYGRWPGLAREQRFEGRDLAVTTDFRDVFGEIVARHLGVGDPRPIFPGYEISPVRFPGIVAASRA